MKRGLPAGSPSPLFGRGRFYDDELQRIIMPVAHIHPGLKRNFKHGSRSVLVYLLVVESDGQRSSEDRHVQVCVGEMLRKPLVFLKDHVKVMDVFVLYHPFHLVAFRKPEYLLNHTIISFNRSIPQSGEGFGNLCYIPERIP